MIHMTRAKAAEVAKDMHIDEEEVHELNAESGGVSLDGVKEPSTATPDSKTPRKVLGELAPNSADSKTSTGSVAKEKNTRTKKSSKKGGKTGKAKPDDTDNTLTLPSDGEGNTESVHKDNEASSSAVSEKSGEELSDDSRIGLESKHELADEKRQPVDVSDILAGSQELVGDSNGSASPEDNGMRATTTKLSDDKVVGDLLVVRPAIETVTINDTTSEVPMLHEPHNEISEITALDAPASPLPSAVPKVLETLRRDTPTKRSTSNKENLEPVESLASEVASTSSSVVGAAQGDEISPSSRTAVPTSSRGRRESRPEDHIKALDDLDEAVEKVNSELPNIFGSPGKKLSANKTISGDSKRNSLVANKTRSAPQASLAKASKTDASKSITTGRVESQRQSTVLGRVSSVKKASGAKPQVPRKSIGPSTKSVQDDTETAEKKKAIIPHSKARPVSLSFPTPPPPPKSKKEPTRSNFTLPGEAVAAKLKAAREERMKKDADEKEKKGLAFKARPAPSSTVKNVPSVRHTASSAARQSLAGAKPLAGSAKESPLGHRRIQSAIATSSQTAPSKRLSSFPSSKLAVKSSSEKTKPLQRRSTITAASASSIDRLSKPRISSLNPPAKPAAVKPKPVTVPRAPMLGHQRTASVPIATNGKASLGTVKGKEVFSRAANAKVAAEKEKKEKEDAARNARAAASERGRLASREWAEKQRLKKLGPKGEVVRKSAGGVGVDGEKVESGNDDATVVSVQPSTTETTV